MPSIPNIINREKLPTVPANLSKFLNVNTIANRIYHKRIIYQ